MSFLPEIVQLDDTTYLVEPTSGELVALRDVADRDLLTAAKQLEEHRREVYRLTGLFAEEVRVRHGIGSTSKAGFHFKVTQTTSFPKGSTSAVLDDLVEEQIILPSDRAKAMPLKATPDVRAIKALIGRLTTSHPAAAQRLADAASTSGPSLRDLRETAVAEAAESL